MKLVAFPGQFGVNLSSAAGRKQTDRPRPASARMTGEEKEREKITEMAKASLEGARVSDARRGDDKPASAGQKETIAYFSFDDAVAQCGALVGGADAADSLAKLRESGLPPQVNLDALDEKLGKVSKLDPQASAKSTRRIMEYFASQYAVYKDRLNREGGGDLDERLKRLDEIMDKHVDRYAKSFSESVGGFLEDNGLKGERDRMYRSFREGVFEMTVSFDAFMKKNGAYADIPEGDEWLKNCGDYMASELCRAYARDDGATTIPRGCYSPDQLGAAASMALMAGAVLNSEHGGAVSEEELGMRLGAMAVKGLAFLETAGGLPQHRETFLAAIGNRMDEILDESDRLIEERGKTSLDQEAHPPLDRSAVASVVGTIVDCYAATNDAKEALLAGAKRGFNAFREKQGNGLDRYRESPYWENMYRSMSARYRAKSNFEKMLDGINTILPAKIPLDSLFGETSLKGLRA